MVPVADPAARTMAFEHEGETTPAALQKATENESTWLRRVIGAWLRWVIGNLQRWVFGTWLRRVLVALI